MFCSGSRSSVTDSSANGHIPIALTYPDDARCKKGELGPGDHRPTGISFRLCHRVGSSFQPLLAMMGIGVLHQTCVKCKRYDGINRGQSSEKQSLR